MDTSKTSWIVSEAIQAQAFRDLMTYIGEAKQQAKTFLESGQLGMEQSRELGALLLNPGMVMLSTSLNTIAFADLVLKKAAELMAVNLANEDLPQ